MNKNKPVIITMPDNKDEMVERTIKAICRTDKVNGWFLPDNELILQTDGWKNGLLSDLLNSKPNLGLRIYKRTDQSNPEYKKFYSFVIGWLEVTPYKFMPIDGFNLTEEQVKEIFNF